MNKKKTNDKKIPKILCAITIEGPEKFLVVPLTSILRIHKESGKMKRLTLNAHVILQHDNYNVGILGVVTGVYPDIDGNAFVDILGKKRVYITFVRNAPDGATMFSWEKFDEEEPTRDEFLSKDFQERIKKARILGIQCLQLEQNGEYENSKNIVPPPLTYTEKNIGSMIDFLALPFNDFIDVDTIRACLQHILVEKSISKRLDFVIKLYEFYFRWNGEENKSAAPAAEYNKEMTGTIRQNIASDLFGTESPKNISDTLPIIVKSSPSVPQRIGLETLDYKTPTPFMSNTLSFFNAHIVGQERAKLHMVRLLVRLKTGLLDPESVMMGGFFCGPTGVGKTRLVEILALFLFGSREGLIKVPCANYSERHEVASFKGAPHGFVGYGDEPFITQWKLDWPHMRKQLRKRFGEKTDALEQKIKQARQAWIDTKQNRYMDRMKQIQLQTDFDNLLRDIGYQPGNYLSIVLFDEIERAHYKFLDFQLEILDTGNLMLMNGEKVSFINTILFWTTNIHGTEILNELSGKHQWGFREEKKIEINDGMWKNTKNAIIKYFAANPAFLGRVGKENIIVFHALNAEQKLLILDQISLPEFCGRIEKRYHIALHITSDAKDFIVQESDDAMNRSLGARALHYVLERLVEDPIAHLIEKGGAEGLIKGDSAVVDVKNAEITISRVMRGNLMIA